MKANIQLQIWQGLHIQGRALKGDKEAKGSLRILKSYLVSDSSGN